jgi:hypothetical protein
MNAFVVTEYRLWCGLTYWESSGTERAARLTGNNDCGGQLRQPDGLINV